MFQAVRLGFFLWMEFTHQVEGRLREDSFANHLYIYIYIYPIGFDVQWSCYRYTKMESAVISCEFYNLMFDIKIDVQVMIIKCHTSRKGSLKERVVSWLVFQPSLLHSTALNRSVGPLRNWQAQVSIRNFPAPPSVEQMASRRWKTLRRWHDAASPAWKPDVSIVFSQVATWWLQAEMLN